MLHDAIHPTHLPRRTAFPAAGVLLVLLFALARPLAADPIAAIDIADAAGDVNTEIAVPLTLSVDPASDPITAMTLNFSGSDAALELVSFSKGPAFSNWADLDAFTPADGIYSMGELEGPGITGTVDLGTLIVRPSAGGDHVVHLTGGSGPATLLLGNLEIAPPAVDPGMLHVTDPCGGPPELTVPADVSVHADAGGCNATFTTLPSATATGGNTMAPIVTFARSDGQPNLLDAYAAADSPIAITWQAADDCGHTSTGVQIITVSGENEVLVDIELSQTLDDVNGPLPGGQLNRCIQFEAWQCPGSTPAATTNEVVSFPTDTGLRHRAAGVSVLVPCGAYNCMTARDPLHSLRSTAPDFIDVGTTYSAAFVGNRSTGGQWLIGGNLNDNEFIDVLDFGFFVTRFQLTYGSTDTDCSTPFFHADISGNGLVFTDDFTFIQINLLKGHQPNCCGVTGVRESGKKRPPEPERSISVSELWRRGLGELAAADINRDGFVDGIDMEVFSKRVEPVAPMGRP